jgi:hypothetical protein
LAKSAAFQSPTIITRGSARGFLVDVGVLGARDEFRSPGLQRLVDLLDRHAGRDQAQAEQIANAERVGRIERRERPLARRRDRVADFRGVIEPFQPQRIVPETVLAAVDQADVRPMIADADQLDAVAMVRRCAARPLPDQRDGLVARVGGSASYIAGGRPGRFMRRVVERKIGGW